MKITNKTKYRDDDVRKLVRAVAKLELVDLTGAEKNAVNVQIIPAREHVSGYARLRGKRIIVRVPPKAADYMANELIAFVAKTIAHEFHHIATGKSGRSVERAWRHSTRYGYHGTHANGFEGTREHYAWTRDFDLRLKEEVKKAKVSPEEKAEKEWARIEKNILAWETKSKRAKNALAKYRKKQKYYQKRLVVLSSAPVVEGRESHVETI